MFSDRTLKMEFKTLYASLHIQINRMKEGNGKSESSAGQKEQSKK